MLRGGSNKPGHSDDLISSSAPSRDKVDDGDRTENKQKASLTAPSSDKEGFDEGDGSINKHDIRLKDRVLSLDGLDEGGYAGSKQTAPLQTSGTMRAVKDEANALDPNLLLAGLTIAPVELITRASAVSLSEDAFDPTLGAIHVLLRTHLSLVLVEYLSAPVTFKMRLAWEAISYRPHTNRRSQYQAPEFSQVLWD